MKTFIKYLTISAVLVLLNSLAFAQTIEEVTVTAARKEQSVQDVAISVQAITAEDLQLQHIETADDLATTVPGVDFSEALGSGVLLKIRGFTIEGAKEKLKTESKKIEIVQKLEKIKFNLENIEKEL